jgi:hypothetical protein
MTVALAFSGRTGVTAESDRLWGELVLATMDIG